MAELLIPAIIGITALAAYLVQQRNQRRKHAQSRLHDYSQQTDAIGAASPERLHGHVPVGQVYRTDHDLSRLLDKAQAARLQ